MLSVLPDSVYELTTLFPSLKSSSTVLPGISAVYFPDGAGGPLPQAADNTDTSDKYTSRVEKSLAIMIYPPGF
jgi:hypothetical protein